MKDVIERLYEQELKGEKVEQTKKNVLSLRIQDSYGFTLNAIANRFKMKKSKFAAILFEEAINNAFYSLNDQDQKRISTDANKLAQEQKLKELNSF